MHHHFFIIGPCMKILLLENTNCDNFCKQSTFNNKRVLLINKKSNYGSNNEFLLHTIYLHLSGFILFLKFRKKNCLKIE